MLIFSKEVASSILRTFNTSNVCKRVTSAKFFPCNLSKLLACSYTMVSEMVQNSQSLYSFTFTAVIVIHEYIYSHSTTKFTFKKYICLHLTTYFLFRNIFTHIYGMYRSHSTAHIRSHSRSKYSFNTVQYSFNIFCALPLRIVRSQLPAAPGEPSLINFV